MKAIEVYNGSDGEVTKAFYAELEKLGVIGIVALNLFRAQKCSERVKKYRGGNGHGRYKDQAYERKSWSMGLLCKALQDHGKVLGITWGWGLDGSQDNFAPWVLYVDLPQGQVSFHALSRGAGPDYDGKWDGSVGSSPVRIIGFCDRILLNAKEPA